MSKDFIFRGTNKKGEHSAMCITEKELMELDLIIAADINDKITEATGKAKADANAMVARRNQKRQKRKLLSNNNELLDILRDSGVQQVNDPKE